jgi:hypothetical protein
LAGASWRCRSGGSIVIFSFTFIAAQLPTERQKAEARVATVIVLHEVDDVDHRLSSPRREEAFGHLGVAVRPFVDPAKTNRVGLILEVPDMDAPREFMESETRRRHEM